MKFNYSFKETTKSKYNSVFKSDNTIVLILAFTALFIPIILGHIQFTNQLIIGSTVNFLLASSAIYLTFKKALPIILIPAIAAVLSAVIFGPFTMFLVYLIPFIWIGNALYVYFIKNFNLLNKVNYFASALGAGIIKSLFIFFGTFALVLAGIVPEVFLIPMGLIQFITAVIGGSLAFTAKALQK